jgi:glycosyltransferase involved in cell wall biosynthesis
MSKNNIPFVFTPHGAYNTIAMEKSKWLKKIYYHFFEKSVLERSNRIHCLGQSEVTGLSKLYSSSKTVLLPYGYENNSNITLNDLDEKDQFIFGFIGRLDIYTKGLDKLIDGFERFVKNQWKVVDYWR